MPGKHEVGHKSASCPPAEHPGRLHNRAQSSCPMGSSKGKLQIPQKLQAKYKASIPLPTQQSPKCLGSFKPAFSPATMPCLALPHANWASFSSLRSPNLALENKDAKALSCRILKCPFSSHDHLFLKDYPYIPELCIYSWYKKSRHLLKCQVLRCKKSVQDKSLQNSFHL